MSQRTLGTDNNKPYAPNPRAPSSMSEGTRVVSAVLQTPISRISRPLCKATPQPANVQKTPPLQHVQKISHKLCPQFVTSRLHQTTQVEKCFISHAGVHAAPSRRVEHRTVCEVKGNLFPQSQAHALPSYCRYRLYSSRPVRLVMPVHALPVLSGSECTRLRSNWAAISPHACLYDWQQKYERTAPGDHS